MTRPKSAAAPTPLEDVEQRAVMAWAEVAKWRGHAIATWLYAIPNGAKLGGSAKLHACDGWCDVAAISRPAWEAAASACYERAWPELQHEMDPFG